MNDVRKCDVCGSELGNVYFIYDNGSTKMYVCEKCYIEMRDEVVSIWSKLSGR